jgi:hypothetical protein
LSAREIKKKFHNSVFSLFIIAASIYTVGHLGVLVARTSIPIRYKVLISEPLQNLVISPFYFAVASSAVLAILVLFRHQSSTKKINFAEAVIIFTAFGTLPQLYPQPDIMHLWWIAPIYICCISILFEKLPEKISVNSSKILTTIFISCTAIGVISAIQFIERPWTEYKLSVLKGTFAHEEKARSLDIFTAIDDFAIKGQTSFDCADGVYAVENGTYLASDQWFVNWGYSEKDNPRIGVVRVICDQSRSYATSEGKRLSMELVYYRSNEQNKSIAVLRKNG